MKHVTRLILAALICCPAYAASDDARAVRDWLEKMITAEQYLNYEGTFIFINGPKVETMQIVHGFDEKGERERITLLTGVSKEVVRDEEHVFSVLPRKKQVLIQPRNHHADAAGFLESVKNRNPWYEFELNGSERIADHYCKIISIFPRDQFRYGYRLCIHNETGLLLKSQTLDNSGQPVEQMIFTNLELPTSVPTEHLQTTMHEKDFELLQTTRSKKTDPALRPDPAWQFTELPPGFKVAHNSMRRLAGVQTSVQHIVLDDGLATVSVFIAPYDPNEPYTEGVASSGALNAVSRLKNGYIVTVIGDVPEKTVKLIAGSLVHDTRVQ
ncbi:MAG TPA: transcriptional regulator [Gammaproteobacteria bacterium]|nr:transcriptional regulator [Gammaproteobacteria bacterium]